MDVYINSAEAISSQNTFDTDDFLSVIEPAEGDYYSVISPKYKEYINPKQLRRMSKIIRMGVASSLKVLKTAEVEQPDAIIVGTGLGCLTDTIKFLDNIADSNETLLNPTAFIQSTHNTISGQIALILGCKNYNFTFSQQAASFETALLDAYLKLQEEKDSNILLGGLDEVTERTYGLIQELDCAKSTSKEDYIMGEGASFFTLSNTASDKNLAKIVGMSHFDDDKGLLKLLQKHNLSTEDIDLIVSGENGKDIDRGEYKKIYKQLEDCPVAKYKKISGDYDTASGFASWVATKAIQTQNLPLVLSDQKLKKPTINTVLIHHYNKTDQHSFILLSKC